MPTDDEQVLEPADDNASLPDADAQQENLTPDDDSQESHQEETVPKEKYTAAREGMDKANLARKKAEAELRRLKKDKGEEDEPDLTDEIDWHVQNASALKLCKDEYQVYRAKGYDRDDALRLAKQDKGVGVKSEPERETGSPDSGVDRTGKAINVDLNDYDKMLGVKPETKEKYRDLVEG